MLSPPASCVFFFSLIPCVGVTCKPGFPDEGEDQVSVEIKVTKAERFRGGPGRGAAGGSHFSWTVVVSGLPWCSDVLRPRVLPVISRVKRVQWLKQNEKPVNLSRAGIYWLSTPGSPLPATFWRREQDQSTPMKPTSIVRGVRPGREASYRACVPGGACGPMQSGPLTGAVVARPV